MTVTGLMHKLGTRVYKILAYMHYNLKTCINEKKKHGSKHKDIYTEKEE